MSKVWSILGKLLKGILTFWGIVIVGFFTLILICNCDVPDYTVINHYRDDANFINNVATVTDIRYSDEGGEIFISFSNLRREYQDHNFYIPVSVADPQLKATILEKIKVGDQVKFTSDPWYYGNGYTMPIVAIWSADGEPLLEKDEGYANLMKYLEE
ncbi:MAG: hypothetical protein J6R82_05350 [Clostridia bacterium]|nr:hypothetical protein [Clostridia bacterium]